MCRDIYEQGIHLASVIYHGPKNLNGILVKKSIINP